MSKGSNSVPQALNPARTGRTPQIQAPTKSLSSVSQDPVDGAFQEKIGRASLYAFSDDVISDEEILGSAVEKGLIPVGLRAYFRMMELWGIGEEEAAGLLGFDHRPSEAEIGIESLKRTSHTIAIYRAMHTLLSRDSANTWIQKPNSAELFGGRPALELLRTGTPGFEAVRHHLATAL